MDNTAQQITQSMNWSFILSRRLTFICFCTSSFILLFLLLYILPIYFNYIQHRSGAMIDDPLLKLIYLNQHDLSALINILTYSSILITFIWLCNHPERLLISIIAYILIVSMRILCIYLLPLEPPIGDIAIYDPIAYGGNIITKDLFFSGHIATLALCFLLLKNSILRNTIAIFTILILVSIIFQRNHYIIDIVIAPFISYASYIFACRCCSWLKTYENNVDIRKRS